MSLYEQLTAAGAENCHPKFIGAVNGKRAILATVIDGEVYLTDEGRAFLHLDVPSDEPSEVVPAPVVKPHARKKKPVDPFEDVLPDD